MSGKGEILMQLELDQKRLVSSKEINLDARSS
jgi:hypothetical protein